MVQPVLEVKKLQKYFGSASTLVKAVDGVSFEVYKGEIVLIIGPSGSGKTTLITVCAGLLKPTAGEVFMDGQDISNLKEVQLQPLRVQRIGFIFQSFHLLSALSAVENTLLPLIIGGVTRREAHEKAKSLLNKLGLSKRFNNLPHQLSAGEKQRVAVARALINHPQLIFADEPTAHLDSVNGRQIVHLLRELARQQGSSVVVVSHDARIKAFADRVLRLEDGKLTQKN